MRRSIKLAERESKIRMHEVEDGPEARSLEEELEIIEGLKKFNPKLTEHDLQQARQYLQIKGVTEGKLYQASVYHSAYKFPFGEAINMVIVGFDYPQAHEIYEIMRDSGVSFEEAKEWFKKKGCDAEKANMVISISKNYGVSEDDALESVGNLGSIAEKLMESGWKHHEISFTYQIEDEWFIVPKSMGESREELKRKVRKAIDRGHLEYTPIKSGSRIYVVNIDEGIGKDLKAAQLRLGSVVADIRETQELHERRRRDEHKAEHMDTTQSEYVDID